MNENDDIFFMNEAIKLAQKAAELGEVPIGALIVRDGVIISEAFNLRETEKLATAHAELSAIEAACKKLGGWRLFGCTLYVTLEPCPMCAGAIVNSRIDRVVYGAPDLRFGACGSLFNINSYPLNHAFEITGGVCEEECKALLSDFFKELRKKKQ
ncbi:MAG: tRNA adenosine(34) deaminase TadA [Clostridia bacterium]|nr:tRNA adenosine(34) deaminase TadA [Clostridia bacterium]